jgi:hypothetical protein
VSAVRGGAQYDSPLSSLRAALQPTCGLFEDTFDAPDVVRPAPFKAPSARGDQPQIELPAKSLLVLSQR